MATQSLEQLIDGLTVEGELYQKHADGSLTCYACGHRCLIKDGRRGICKVRFNAGGTLKVPWGYVGALQCDPTEKKPFFHIYPGSDTLTFGMLGCDLHCPYCFPPGTPVVTDRGVLPIEAAFALADRVVRTPAGEAARPTGLRAVTASGELRPVVQVFRHRYAGPLTVIRPYYLPALRCTADHRVYATADPAQAPVKVPAGQLTTKHFLAVPRHYDSAAPQVVDVRRALEDHAPEHTIPHKPPDEAVEHIMAASAAGLSSRALGRALGKDPSHIRHVGSKVRRGLWTGSRAVGLNVEAGRVRFGKEHGLGLPLAIALDESFARLLGYYCAEGSVQTDPHRPNSHALVFTFGRHEASLAQDVVQLIEASLGVTARLTPRRTTLAVTLNKSSAALLFKSLCGTGALAKHVPAPLFGAPGPVVKAFLEACCRGDGHTIANGKVSVTTRSRELAYGVAWLCLKVGSLASIYENAVGARRLIEGREVRQSPVQYSVVWYEGEGVRRRVVFTKDYYLIPIRSLTTEAYEGEVYNLEVEGEHNYLAGFFAVANCQNWVTSQALRDPASELAGAQPALTTPQRLVAQARQQGAALVGSSYNEPLITSEWAVAVFKEAVRAGLKCVYISNGNATPEVLDYIRPYVVGYKIDLKTMSDRSYRKLGAVLQNVLDGIKMVHERGFWLEIVTLTIPGFNDSNEELWDAARFLASLSPDIPWHVTAFHQDYKMTEPDNTSAATLLRAAEIGREAGLRYVYAGNLPGRVGEHEHTFCPQCGTRLIERYGYVILSYRLTAQGTCPDCGTRIPGIWTDRPETVRLYGPGRPRRVASPIHRYRSDTADG